MLYGVEILQTYQDRPLLTPLHLEDPMSIFEDIKSQTDVIKMSPEPFVRDKLLNFVITI